MEPLLNVAAAIENLPVLELLKTSFFTYPLVNAAHILAIGALVTTVLLMDLRVIGFFRHAEPGIPIPLLRRIALSAFAVAALTGLAMFAISATDYVVNRAFLIKIGLIVLAILNFLIFMTIAGKSGERPDRHPVPPAAKAGAALSILLWLGVAICGRFIGFL